MGLLLTDSFDTYTTVLQKWDINSGATIISAAARNGAKGIQFQNGGFASFVTKNLQVSRQTVIAGSAVNIQTNNTEGGGMAFADSGTVQCCVTIDAGGVVRARRGNAGGVLLGTSSLIFPLTQWHYLEVLVTISSTAGVVLVIMDSNVTLLSLTNVNTQNTGNATLNQFTPGNTNTSGVYTAWYDDLYILDTTGNQFNGFLGNVTIVGQLPVANGTENDFQRGGGVINAQNWQQVNENPPDDNTTYVFSSIVGQQDRYLYPAVPQASGICYGAMLWPRLQADDAGTRKFQGVMASQGVVQQSGSDINAIQGYTDVGIPFAIDPATGVQYTLAGINAAESGIVITG